jgi:hypothetical protein
MTTRITVSKANTSCIKNELFRRSDRYKPLLTNWLGNWHTVPLVRTGLYVHIIYMCKPVTRKVPKPFNEKAYHYLKNTDCG